MNEENATLLPKWAKLSIIAVIIFVLVLIFSPFTVIGANEKGLKFTMGKISPNVYSNGLQFHAPLPFQNFEKVSMLPQQIDNKVEVGPGGSITKDNQTIGADTTVFYKYKADGLVDMWQNYGKEKLKAIITTSLQESFKAEIGNYTIFDISVNQDKIRGNVYASLKLKMANYPVEISELKITNYDWSDDFDKQIKETMNLTQQVKQKEQEKNMAEQEAQKGVVQAQAQKTIAITTAEGEKAAAQLMADAKALEGEGIRKYNQSINANLEQEIRFRTLLIEQTKADKWDGHLVPSQVFSPIPLNLGATMQDLGIVK
jgi:regulator of protease activity HflC (stomatin/prohibitin superfamily)